MVACPECGAQYSDADDSCTARFDVLLALDHSRQEPWGSRHGQAFSAFALQHPLRYATSLDAAWRILYRIHVAGDAPSRVLAALAGRAPTVSAAWDVPPRPNAPHGAPALTIASLGAFAAESYAADLEAWCDATLDWYGVVRR